MLPRFPFVKAMRAVPRILCAKCDTFSCWGDCFSAAYFGVMPVLARIAYEAKADPITVLFVRFGIAAVVMFAILFASKTPLPRGLLLLELVLLGAIAYVGESLAYFLASDWLGNAAVFLRVGSILLAPLFPVTIP